MYAMGGSRLELDLPPVPQLPYQHGPGSSASSTHSIPRSWAQSVPPPKRREPFQSNMLKGAIEKPWLQKKDPWLRVAWWVTVLLGLLGVLASAALVFFNYRSTPRLGKVCLVMSDDFDQFDTTNTWTQEVGAGGWNFGTFDWTTNSPNNSFVDNGILYIVPTLTQDSIGHQPVYDGYTANLTGCTEVGNNGCTVHSSLGQNVVVNPAQSARITTRQSFSIAYGRVEIRAKMPRGDWLWPGLSMLPVKNTYGAWPLSGEIDIAQSRGNDPTYPAQGRNWITSALNWGPDQHLNEVTKTRGWRFMRRSSFDEGFHDYVLEWSPDFMWMYIDKRIHRTMDLRIKKSFWDLGNFPATVQNGSQQVVLQDPWVDGTRNAPFDQNFYLVMNVAVGGTSGWFEDGVGNKPWLDGSASAMRDFAFAVDSWSPTWPQDPKDRGMAIDFVRMYQSC